MTMFFFVFFFEILRKPTGPLFARRKQILSLGSNTPPSFFSKFLVTRLVGRGYAERVGLHAIEELNFCYP